MSLSQLLFSTNGRIPRSTYWFYSFGYLGVSIVAFFLDMALGTMDQRSGMGVFSVILSFLAIIPGFAVSIKRCHDRGHSGWFLLWGLIPFVSIWIAIELGFLRGTFGENQYGPDPI